MNSMNAADAIIEQLRNAQTDELPRIRVDYDAYLTTLDTDAQKRVIGQVEPVLRELVQQSVNRLERAAAAYLYRSEKQAVL